MPLGSSGVTWAERDREDFTKGKRGKYIKGTGFRKTELFNFFFNIVCGREAGNLECVPQVRSARNC